MKDLKTIAFHLYKWKVLVTTLKTVPCSQYHVFSPLKLEEIYDILLIILEYKVFLK